MTPILCLAISLLILNVLIVLNVLSKIDAKPLSLTAGERSPARWTRSTPELVKRRIALPPSRSIPPANVNPRTNLGPDWEPDWLVNSSV